MKTSPSIVNKGDHSKPTLQNPRHERFAQELATGKTADAAYVLAGYKENRSNAARLNARQNIQRRVAEIQSLGAELAAITPSGEHAPRYIISDRPMTEEEWERGRCGECSLPPPLSASDPTPLGLTAQ
jgi:hypothetical protein